MSSSWPRYSRFLITSTIMKICIKGKSSQEFSRGFGQLPASRCQNQGKILDAIRGGMDTAFMTRVTGKFQITLPKRLVDAFGIRVGDEVELVAAGDAIRIVPANAV